MTLITPDRFDRALDIIAQAEEIAIDCETYWTSSWENKKIIGVSVYGEAAGRNFNGYFPFRHEWDSTENLHYDCLGKLTEVLNKVPSHTFHNAKFDRQRFRLEGLSLTSSFFCTMVGSYMLDENSSHELEDLAEKYEIDHLANKRKQHIHAVREQIVWHQIPPEIMVPYACGDTRNTHYLKKRIIPRLEKQELYHLWPTEEAYSDCLMNVEYTGIDIDPVMAEEFADKALRRMIAIKKELGFDPAKPLPLAIKLFKDLRLPIYELGKPSKQFPKGRPKMGEEYFSKWDRDAKTPEARKVMDLILEFRGLQKQRSTWYIGWPNLMDSKHKLHPTFNQHVAVTTRLTCVEPNVQQIPRDEEDAPVKKLLRAPVGYELWQADYSQIEYRLAGVLSNDPVILGAYRSGSDMHQVTADRLGQTRYGAKTTNFRFIYEGGPGNYADAVGCTLEEAKRVYNDYHQTYHVMFRFAAKVNASAAQRGYIKLWDGRKRHFRFHFEAKKAWNSYVQGGAAIICKQGMVRCHQDKTLLSKMNSQVHDAVWFLIPSHAVHTEKKKIAEHLEWPTYDKRFKIPFPVDWTRLA
jgi:DNA polymerase I